MKSGRNRANGHRRIQAVGVALLLLAMIAGVAPGGRRAAVAQEEEGGLRLVGKIDQPAAAHNPITAGTARVIAVDSEERLLYYTYSDSKRGDNVFLREYDLNAPIPRYRREGLALPISVFNPQQDITPKTTAIDTKRRLLYVMHTQLCLPCEEGVVPSATRAEIIDLKSLTRIGGLNFTTILPGAQLHGITYSAEDDRLYFIGEFFPVPALGVRYENPEGVMPATVTIVAALDAGTGALAWARPIPECRVPMANRFLAALIARSQLHDALYFACIRPFVYPGESGVMRLSISPRATQAETLQFRTELFPISGMYTNIDGVRGNAYFDPGTDRFFMQSVAATTPGAWVFDGRLSSWVGFIAAPSNDNFFVGMNQGRGRYYMGAQGAGEPIGYLVAADGRSSPVPQGRVIPLTGNLASEVFTDSKTRRLFLRVEPPTGQTEGAWLVYEDTASVPLPPEPTDYDALTSDIPEGPNTASAFAGTINGYAARATLVGGLGGIRTFCAGGVEGVLCPLLSPEVPALRELNLDFSSADRGIYAARVASLDVRNVGASASARALELDTITDGEYVAKVQEPTGERVATATDNPQAGDDVERMLKWPHDPATCLDSAGIPLSNEAGGPGGGSTVACDLAKGEANATTRFAPFSLAGISVGASSFTARARRDPALGAVTESTATVRAVEILAPDGSTVSIGEIVARAQTSAFGRSGTAAAGWSRTLSNVVVRNASGEVTFQCGEADSCNPGAAIEAIHRVMGDRIHVSLPVAELLATPKGAFAGVQKTEAEYLSSSTVNNDYSRAVPAVEIVVLNDTVEKSRLLIQFGAIQASSIYGISPLPGNSVFEPPVFGGVPDIPVIPTVLPTTFGPPLAGNGNAPRGPGAKLVSAALFLIRSPKDALLVGLIGLLFVGAGTLLARRRTLLGQLEAGP